MARKKRAKNGAAKAKAPKPVDQEVKGSKKAAAPDKGPLSGAGHNLSAVKKLVVPFAERYNRLLDKKEEESASYMADARVLIEDAANDLGCSKKLVRMALQQQRAKMKQDEKESVMDRDEVDKLDTMRDALGLYSELPLGQAALKAAASKPKASTQASKKHGATNGAGKVVQIAPSAREDEEAGEEEEAASEAA